VPGTWMASDERERLINVLMLGREATRRVIGASLASL